MSAPDRLTVAALLISRICHDLAAPAGAVGNGIEMLREDGGAGLSDAIELLEFSSNETLRRLQFFRLAFGAAGGLGAATPLSGAREVAVGFFAERKANLDWPDGGPAELPQPAVKLALNLVLLAADALPRGGTVAVSLVPGRLTVTAAGDRPDLRTERRAALRGEVPAGGLSPHVWSSPTTQARSPANRVAMSK